MNQYNPTLLLSLLVSRDHPMAACEAWSTALRSDDGSEDDPDRPDDSREGESNRWDTQRELS